MKIGFIGLGNMGAPMAANLAKAGHEVTGFDLAPFEVEGLARAATAAEAATGRDCVVTMLPNGAILASVMAEIAPAADKGACLIDCSTVDVASARAAHQSAAEHGLLSVDAPVSGGVGGAAAGTLTFMCGGSDEAFAKAAPLFEIMGQKAVHCGEGGAGQAAKICNNMVLGISMIAVSEAFALAEKLGLDHQKLFDISSKASGQCWSLTSYCPVPGPVPTSPANRDYQPGFTAAMMLKDLRLAHEAAAAAGAATPLGRHAEELYTRFAEGEGQAGVDFSGIIKMIRNLDG